MTANTKPSLIAPFFGFLIGVVIWTVWLAPLMGFAPNPGVVFDRVWFFAAGYWFAVYQYWRSA